MPGGQPYGCLIGDYYLRPFRARRRDPVRHGSDCLRGPCAVHHRRRAVAAEHGNVAGVEQSRDLTKIFGTPEYAAWRSLRESEDARYIGLTMPRVPARMPYGAKTYPVEEFAFEEDTEGADHNKYVWSNCGVRHGDEHHSLVQDSTAGARAFAALNPAAWSKVCRSIRSRPTTAAWT